MVFLKQLIREWDDERSQERISKLPATEQAQAELLRVRLDGKLPHIDIAGDDFTIDWRLRELRETAAPWNRISINGLRESESGKEYLGLYDVSKKKLYTVDNEMTVVPQNITAFAEDWSLSRDDVDKQSAKIICVPASVGR